MKEVFYDNHGFPNVMVPGNDSIISWTAKSFIWRSGTVTYYWSSDAVDAVVRTPDIPPPVPTDRVPVMTLNYTGHGVPTTIATRDKPDWESDNPFMTFTDAISGAQYTLRKTKFYRGPSVPDF